MEKIINPKPINKSNFSDFGDVITTKDIEPIEINNGYAKRFDGIANLDTKEQNGEATISIFSALKRNFPMKETTFLVLVAPKGDSPVIEKIQSFIVPPGIGINYKPGTWHFPLISTENMNFLVVDRKGSGENLVIENLEEKKIVLKY